MAHTNKFNIKFGHYLVMFCGRTGLKIRLKNLKFEF